MIAPRPWLGVFQPATGSLTQTQVVQAQSSALRLR